MKVGISFVRSRMDSTAKRLDAYEMDIAELEDLSCVDQLERVDLSRNRLKSLEGLRNCVNIKWLNVAKNQLSSLDGLRYLKNMTVFNASGNKISSTNPIKKLKGLKALILSGNEIRNADEVKRFKQLNTLVLSNNELTKFFASRLVNLEKLSLSHNLLPSIPLIPKLSLLRELRLNDNRIKAVPDQIVLNAQLVIVDLGNNRIKRLAHALPLGQLPLLKNLNLKGNPICSESGYGSEAFQIKARLEIFDGRRLQPKETGGPEEEESLTEVTDSVVKEEPPPVEAQQIRSPSPAKKPASKKDREAYVSVSKKPRIETSSSSSEDELGAPEPPRGKNALRYKDSGVVAIQKVKAKKKRKRAPFDPSVRHEPDLGTW
ncbi:leucine-rich repeat-containing protein 23-like isoform X2 [Oscarella lobularis]|uniref:leucine-rich repeat-containing protein 23-like isoform X2 n=1 Tax=Oscarella lobularis TaxID=121494 RepID=UPI00331418BB